MHVLFVHKNFPAQFGHIARHLIDQHQFRCTFVSEKPPAQLDGLERIQYRCKSGSTKETHFFSRTLENQVWHSHALFEALEARPDIVPDLIVGHSGFVSTLYLRELYDCPIVNYFEFFYHPHDSDLDFRRDLPAYQTPEFLRARTRNAIFLLDLNNCNRGYSPTNFQRQQLPAEYHAEPSVGLVSGEDGLDIVLKILDASPAWLKQKGILVVEVGESAQSLIDLLPTVPFLWLEFNHGGDGIFLLEYDQLVACQSDVRDVLEQRKYV